MSLGLIFTQESTGRIKLTLAGEAIMNGVSPVYVLKNQIFKYQFPSAFSVGRGVQVASRFRIHPFRFLLRVLRDSRIGYLTEDEIAKIIVTEAENESERCFSHIVSRIIQYRNEGDTCLDPDFFLKYQSSKGGINLAHPYSHLSDLANTLVNWLEYTQLVTRDDGKVKILYEKLQEVDQILAKDQPIIDRPESQEYFQRKYGIDPDHQKDDRNLLQTTNVTPRAIAKQKIMQAYISASLNHPITKITSSLVDSIAESTGIDDRTVEEILMATYPSGSVGAFMTKYFEMAFKGRDEATEFELATAELFESVWGFQSKHVGSIGLTPDVLIISDSERFQAIIDNKAYNNYSINNDHRNRMIHNYLANVERYSPSTFPMAFFSYIAGGFGSNIDRQIGSIVSESGVHGSAVSVSNVITMAEATVKNNVYSHANLKRIMSLDRQVLLSDL